MSEIELDTGHNLAEARSYQLNHGQTLVTEIYKLNVVGGHIYFRDVLVSDDTGVQHLTQTATFVAST